MLSRARPDETTVTQIATFCGIRELGRFSKTFRTYHGQLPSLVLRLDPEAFSAELERSDTRNSGPTAAPPRSSGASLEIAPPRGLGGMPGECVATL
jgi:AraC-like DNA-binding protein